MKNKQIRIMLHISIMSLLILSNCNFTNIQPIFKKNDSVSSIKIEVEKLKLYKGFDNLIYSLEDNYENDSLYWCYPIDNIYISFISRWMINKYKDYKNKNAWDNYRIDKVLLIIDNEDETLTLYHDIHFNHINYSMHIVEDYYYFYGKDGSIAIWREPIEPYISKILIFSKTNHKNPKQLHFNIQEVVLAEQKRENFRVVTVLLKPETSFLKKQINKIILRQPIGEYVNAEKYYEYIYNDQLELISKKEIDKENIY